MSRHELLIAARSALARTLSPGAPLTGPKAPKATAGERSVAMREQLFRENVARACFESRHLSLDQNAAELASAILLD
jgi:hypothetical protein